MNEEKQSRIKQIGSWEIQRSNPDGEVLPKNFLTGDFIRNLCISRGTLTPEERAAVQNHMQITINMLEKLLSQDIFEEFRILLEVTTRQ